MIATTPLPVAISCSPRPGGNSDRAATLFASYAENAGGVAPEVLRLRRYDITPCLACYRCEHDADGRCFLQEQDESAPLFEALMSAPYVYIAAPIFFYHVPAQFKAWIDRSQSFWLRRNGGDERMKSLPKRKAYVTLIAGRKAGDKMFEGSLLSIKYFLKTFNLEMQEPLTLRGLDTAGALAGAQDAREQIEAMAQLAAKG